MNIRKYLLILVAVIVLSVVASTIGIGQAFIVGGLLSIIHEVFMLKSKKYENLIYSKLGKPVELGFPDKEKFYKDQGINLNSKVNKYFNTQVLFGLIIILQAAFNYKSLGIKLSALNAILVGAGLFAVAIFIDVIDHTLAKKSKDYSDFYLKIVCVSIFITIPVMFFGLIWVLGKQY
ncbi:hypothetical protein [Clostridium fungisolvens]|uniref:Uncharacterized protein n=1 Tax=Clostridium fungisolvens TaxID=1604897 RepID=A0A6V8SGB1_9CLOT|nr:hypothetical protein [Clostridium fungisolvens]GFP76217.1 hypothetical protein bsdtw1_02318 [Clostridium fungisolvens]